MAVRFAWVKYRAVGVGLSNCAESNREGIIRPAIEYLNITSSEDTCNNENQ